VKISNFTAFGAFNNPNGVTIASGATLDVGGFIAANVAGGFGSTPFTISGDGAGVGGAGAIINSGTQPQINAFQSITLAGNASVGGPNRFDIRNGTPVLNLNSNTLTKTGPGQFSLVGAAVNAGNIVVNGGTLSLEGATTIPDNADGRSITVNSNATLQFLGIGGGSISRQINLVGSSITINDAGTSPTVDSNISLQSNIVVNGPAADNLTLNGNVVESGGARSLSKTGANMLTLNGSANSYTGLTNIAGGSVQLNGGGTLGPIDGGPSTTLTKNNGGNFVIGRSRVPTFTINGGIVKVAANGQAAGVSVASSFTNNTLLDLSDNHLIVKAVGQTGSWTGSNYDGLTGQIATARGTGNFWDGASGISTSQTQAIGSNYTTLGIATASDIRPNTATETSIWAGQTITGTDTLIMYTYGGDATLDGKINIDDYVRIDSGISAGLTGWVNGDFNYDGKVSIDDYITVIDANIGNQTGTFFSSGGLAGGGGGLSGVTAVPEPAAGGLFMISAAMLARRRSRRAVAPKAHG
jgi:autotransporter-associated beta strand protein